MEVAKFSVQTSFKRKSLPSCLCRLTPFRFANKLVREVAEVAEDRRVMSLHRGAEAVRQ
jgi:hypothetical protein